MISSDCPGVRLWGVTHWQSPGCADSVLVCVF